jgi:hypothetical protein
MSLSSIVGRIIPTVTSFVASGGNPVAATATLIATDQQRDAAKKARIQNEIARNKYREELNMAFGDPMTNVPLPVGRPANLGQPGFFERLGNIGSSVGNTLLTGLESAVPSVINNALFGRGGGGSGSSGPAVTTQLNLGAQESSGSGTIEAGGSLIPGLLSGARNLLKSPGGQLIFGTGAGAGLSMLTSDGKKMRITRKMKSQARTVLNIAGGNISVAADILNISDEMLISILLKRFRNDGPVVTKAALRKTKSTIRRLHNMQDVLKSITPTAAGRRRAPMKRAMSTTLIKN